MTTPSHSSGHTESATERCCATSTGSESLTVVPSVTEPARGIVPVAASSASTSVVLPAAECPTSATLRIFSGLSAVSKVAVAVFVPAFLFDIPAPRQIVVGSLRDRTHRFRHSTPERGRLTSVAARSGGRPHARGGYRGADQRTKGRRRTARERKASSVLNIHA